MWNQPDLLPSGVIPQICADVEREFTAARAQIALFGAADSAPIIDRLFDLDAQLEVQAPLHVDRGTRHSLDLEARNSFVFRKPPILPPEEKRDGQWVFRPVRFEVIPHHLFVFAVRFSGSRTLRIKSVTFHFRDGSCTTFREWESSDQGNGQSFRKRQFTPWIPVYGDASQREARPLAAVEILGTAQDRDHQASLSFNFRVPDPDMHPFGRARSLLQSALASWRDKTLNIHDLMAFREDWASIQQAIPAFE